MGTFWKNKGPFVLLNVCNYINTKETNSFLSFLLGIIGSLFNSNNKVGHLKDKSSYHFFHFCNFYELQKFPPADPHVFLIREREELLSDFVDFVARSV